MEAYIENANLHCLGEFRGIKKGLCGNRISLEQPDIAKSSFGCRVASPFPTKNLSDTERRSSYFYRSSQRMSALFSMFGEGSR